MHTEPPIARFADGERYSGGPVIAVVRQKSLTRRMKRFRQISVRSLLVIVTLLAVWLAYRTNAARQQQRDAAVIRAAGGAIYYDWMLKPIYDAEGNVPYLKVIKDPDAIAAPKWLRKSIGDEYFQHVAQIHLPSNRINDDVIAALVNLPGLTEICLSAPSPEHPLLTEAEVEALKERVKRACSVQVSGPFR